MFSVVGRHFTGLGRYAIKLFHIRRQIPGRGTSNLAEGCFVTFVVQFGECTRLLFLDVMMI